MLLALFRKFSAPGIIKHSLHSFLSFFLPTWVDSRITSLDRWPNPLGMGLVPPPLLWEVLQVLMSPREWNRSLCHGSWHPMMVIGQSPLACGSLLLWSVQWDCTLPDVSPLATLEMYVCCCFLMKRNCVSYNFWCWLPASQHMLAVGTALLQGG